jgi:hypothetical protein
MVSTYSLRWERFSLKLLLATKDSAMAFGIIELSGDGGLMDGYIVLRVEESQCPTLLAEDLRGLSVARWLAAVLRIDFEAACFDAPIRGTLGTFDGVMANSMPNYWRTSGDKVAGSTLWEPDGRHPLGRWFSEVASKLPALPANEVFDAILRRHGIESSREPAPQVKDIVGGWALLVHKPKPKAYAVPGVTRDDTLLSLWDPDPAQAQEEPVS